MFTNVHCRTIGIEETYCIVNFMCPEIIPRLEDLDLIEN